MKKRLLKVLVGTITVASGLGIGYLLGLRNLKNEKLKKEKKEKEQKEKLQVEDWKNKSGLLDQLLDISKETAERKGEEYDLQIHFTDLQQFQKKGVRLSGEMVTQELSKVPKQYFANLEEYENVRKNKKTENPLILMSQFRALRVSILGNYSIGKSHVLSMLCFCGDGDSKKKFKTAKGFCWKNSWVHLNVKPILNHPYCIQYIETVGLCAPVLNKSLTEEDGEGETQKERLQKVELKSKEDEKILPETATALCDIPIYVMGETTLQNQRDIEKLKQMMKLRKQEKEGNPYPLIVIHNLIRALDSKTFQQQKRLHVEKMFLCQRKQFIANNRFIDYYLEDDEFPVFHYVLVHDSCEVGREDNKHVYQHIHKKLCNHTRTAKGTDSLIESFLLQTSKYLTGSKDFVPSFSISQVKGSEEDANHLNHFWSIRLNKVNGSGNKI